MSGHPRGICHCLSLIFDLARRPLVLTILAVSTFEIFRLHSLDGASGSASDLWLRREPGGCHDRMSWLDVA